MGIPAALALATVRAAALDRAGHAVATVSQEALALADNVVRSMSRGGWKLSAALSVLLVATGAGMFAYHAPEAPGPAAVPSLEQPPASPQGGVDFHGDPLPPGARARLGSLRWRTAGEIGQFAMAADGKTIAVASGDDAVSIFEAATGRLVHRLAAATSGLHPGVAFTPDGKVLAAPQQSQVRRWDTASWRELPAFRLQGRDAGKLHFAPDGRYLASVGMNPEDHRNIVILIDTAAGKELYRHDGRTFYKEPTIAFAPDGNSWAYVDRHELWIGIYETATGKELRRLKGHERPPWSVAFAPDGRQVAATDRNGTLRFWDVATGQLLPGRGEFQVLDNLTYSPDGTRLAGWSNGRPAIYDLATKKQLDCKGPRWAGENPVLFSPDGKLLISAHDHCLYLWHAQTLAPALGAAGHDRTVMSLAFAPDGNTVITAGGDSGFARRWDAATGKPLSPFSGLDDFVYALARSPRTNVLAVDTGINEGAIALLDATTGKRLRKLDIPKSPARCLTFTDDGRTLASQQDKEIRLWEVATGKLTRTLPAPGNQAGELALSPDGQLIACGGFADGIHLWQAATAKELPGLPAGRSRVGSHPIAFSPDGRLLASAGGNAALSIWVVASGTVLWQAPGDEGSYRFVTFSPDGRTLASGGVDRSIHLWEVISGKKRWAFEGHASSLRCGAFAPDGRSLATGSCDSTVLIWDLSAPADAIADGKRGPELLWDDLASPDARTAYQAMAAFTKDAQAALAWFDKHLDCVPAAEDPRIAQALAELSSDAFARRAAARRTLEVFGPAAEPALRRALSDPPSVEARQQLLQLLDKLDPRRSLTVLRNLRALEVLERIGGDAARLLVVRLADDAPGATLTQEAKSSLRRW